jgi:hypothetical protein
MNWICEKRQTKVKVVNTENRHLLEGAVGRAITERNDHELGLDNEAIGDGALANGGQCCASTLRKMRNIPLVISEPFSGVDTFRPLAQADLGLFDSVVGI